MVNYYQFGYKSIHEYEIDFIDSLLVTNHTYDFFVDWVKVFSNLDKYNNEINYLNKLTKCNSNDIEETFVKIIYNNPKIINILPLLIALRKNKIDIFNMESKKFKSILFNRRINMDELVVFVRKSGLFKLFLEIDDLYSYLTGVEVGLDTNARKNRSGTNFENIIEELIKEKIKDRPDLKYKTQYTLNIGRIKRADFLIYKNNIPKYVIECNFYNSTGSKPIEVANAYIDLNNKIKNRNMEFIWITDGLGWKKMFSTLKAASSEIDFIVNYNFFNKYFNKIIK